MDNMQTIHEPDYFFVTKSGSQYTVDTKNRTIMNEKLREPFKYVSVNYGKWQNSLEFRFENGGYIKPTPVDKAYFVKDNKIKMYNEGQLCDEIIYGRRNIEQNVNYQNPAYNQRFPVKHEPNLIISTRDGNQYYIDTNNKTLTGGKFGNVPEHYIGDVAFMKGSPAFFQLENSKLFATEPITDTMYTRKSQQREDDLCI